MAEEDWAPTGWDEFFDESQDVTVTRTVGDVSHDTSFRVYTAGKTGPVFVCFHGAGHTSLSWALVARTLKREGFRIMAYDCRGHGHTIADNEKDLSSETMIADALSLLQTLYTEEKPPIILVGHSMGGAVAARVAATRKVPGLVGLVVLDVVEGTALAALAHMQGLLRSWPQEFDSVEGAVKWSVLSGNIRQVESARVSVPHRVREGPSGKVTWRTDLADSERYWEGWYTGLSDIFLSCPIPKVLILAGTDRLDKSLTIGQMQGKFQMLVFPAVGHVVMEDDPARTAQALASFAQRHNFGGKPPVIGALNP